MSSDTSMTFDAYTVEALDRRERYYQVKRVLDVILAGLALVVLCPVMLAVALTVKLDSPGPVLFRQKRAGARLKRLGGKRCLEIGTFEMLKFRSMVQNADQGLHQAHVRAFVEGRLASNGNGGAAFKLTNDPRVTRVGRFLRRTSLDELPQLINVLRGEMSLVGPRPVPLYEVGHYDDWHRERLNAQPGITGLWQVTGRCALGFDEMVRLDIDYVRRQSLVLDAKILVLTIPAVLSGRGAG